MPHPSKPDRKRKRLVRAMQASEGISYSEALRRVGWSDPPRTYDLKAARHLMDTIDEADLSWREVFNGELAMSDRWLEDVAALLYLDELERARAHGLGLFRRSAQLVGLAVPSFEMPHHYPARVVAAARLHVSSAGHAAIEDPLLVPERFDAPAELEAEFMLKGHPRRFVGASVIAWLDEDHPERLATLAGITWQSAPAPLPHGLAGAGLLGALDDVDAGGLLDAEALSAFRRVLRDWMVAEEDR
jgi:hypothetical protein